MKTQPSPSKKATTEKETATGGTTTTPTPPIEPPEPRLAIPELHNQLQALRSQGYGVLDRIAKSQQLIEQLEEERDRIDGAIKSVEHQLNRLQAKAQPAAK